MTDDKAFDILRSAGWSPNRNINISQMIEYMTIVNLPIFEEASTFLKQFENLKFYFSPDNSDNNIGFAFIVKYGVDMLNDSNNELLSDYKKMLKVKNITVIGSYSSSMTLLIDDENNIYAVEDNYVVYFGKKLDGVINIIKGEFTLIPSPDWW